MGGEVFGAGPGGDTAAQLLSYALADATKTTYGNKWLQVVAFCQASGYSSLPASTETVACYLGHIFERGTVAPGSLQNYMTPINSVHVIMGWERPAVGPLLMALRQGYARVHANLSHGLRAKRVPLPAAVLLRLARLGLDTADAGLRRRMAGLVLTALTFCRPGGGANLLVRDVTLTDGGPHVNIPDYKHGSRTDRERLLIDIPRRTGGRADAPLDLVTLHVSSLLLCSPHPEQPLFAALGDHRPLPTEVATAWMQEGLYLLDMAPPPGGVFSGHSLRACSATAFRSIGGPLDAIAQLMGMKNKATDVVSASYVDSLAVPDDAAREIYDRYVIVRA